MLLTDDFDIPYPRQYWLVRREPVPDAYTGWCVPYRGSLAYLYWWGATVTGGWVTSTMDEYQLQGHVREGHRAVRTYPYPGLICPALLREGATNV